MVNKLKEQYHHLMTAASKAFPVLLVSSIFLSIANVLNSFEMVKFLEKVAYIGMISVIPLFNSFYLSSLINDVGYAPGFLIGVAAAFSKTNILGSILGSLIASKIYQKVSQNVQVTKNNRYFLIMILYPVILTSLPIIILEYVLKFPLHQVIKIILGFAESNNNAIRFLWTNLLALGIIFDFGGPINKLTSFLINSLFLDGYNLGLTIKMASGMMAPIGIGLAKLLKGDQAGKNTILQGASFITEALIPYHIQEGSIIRFSSIIGTAVGVSLITYFNIESFAVQGGLLMTLTYSKKREYYLSFFIGVLSTLFSYFLLLKINKEE